MKKIKKEKVLLHSCCAVCAGHPLELLKSDGYEPVAYFFNPNIYPNEEYEKRLEAMRTLCNAFDCELIAEDYNPDFYNEIMTDYKNCPEGSERCFRCFEYRLLKTVFKAKELKINSFTTTLTSSPHKKYEIIQNIGLNFSKYFGINYLDYNFKKKDGFLKTLKIADSLNIYRQNYCGCYNSTRILSAV